MGDSKQILTKVFDALRSIEPVAESNGGDVTGSPFLTRFPAEERDHLRSVLLTLHFLFPHELLPALDLLDRRLIACLRVFADRSDSPADGLQDHIERFYVQSASAVTESISRGFGKSTGRYRNAYTPANTFYEVDVDSWNCSCPAFAYATVKLLGTNNKAAVIETSGDAASMFSNGPGIHAGDTASSSWQFGGLYCKDSAIAPVCKHILAVSLSKAAPDLFVDGTNIRDVTREELAGWAAGWGER